MPFDAHVDVDVDVDDDVDADVLSTQRRCDAFASL